MKNILHIATMDQGGAWTATYRLHHLLKKSHHSKLLVKTKSLYDHDILQYRKSQKEKLLDYLFFKWRSLLKQNDNTFDKNYYFHNSSENFPNYNLVKFIRENNIRPDIVILHWVSGFVNTKNILDLEKAFTCKVLWYCLDMSPLTGGCHYAWSCENYKSQCHNCPALPTNNFKDIAFKNFKIKQKNIALSNLTVVSSTPWVSNQVAQGALFQNKKHKEILLSVNPDIFAPIDKKIARTVLRVPVDKKIILTGSSSVNDLRKGTIYFFEAISTFYKSLSENERNDYFILISGDYHDMYKNLPFPHKCTGFLKDEISLALTYQSADIYICTSIEDTGPMMINESIQCGTPVIAFEMGVAVKLVEHGITGYRNTLKDSDGLAKSILTYFTMDDKMRAEMSNNCRKIGLELLHPKRQQQAFEDLFN